MADVFISYSRQDKERVTPLVAAIEALGWTVWWDPAIVPGEEFDALIGRELEAARALVVVWTPASVDSRWVRGEARDAADRGILVPVRFETARLPIDFRAVHTTDLDGWAEDAQSAAFAGLTRALESKLGPPKKAQPAVREAPARPAITICVLPFANMSGDPEQEYFSDGITEDIITDLGKVSALSIVARNVAFAFKGATGGFAEIGSRTGATHVLLGSVRRAGARVRITAQLVVAANDAQVWAERYDRDLKDIFELQDEISKAIVAALKITLLPEEKVAIEQRGASDPEAYQLYLIGRQLWQLDSTRNSELCVRICRQVVELDPGFAKAWASLSIAQSDLLNRGKSRETGDAAAAMALKLDPQLSDAHVALAYVHRQAGRFVESLAAAQTAIQLDPNSVHGNLSAGNAYFALRRMNESLQCYETAAALDETSFISLTQATQTYDAIGDVAKSRDAAKRAMARIEKVIALQPDHTRAISFGVLMLVMLGEKDRARSWVMRGKLLDPDDYLMLYNFACAMVRLPDFDMAISLLHAVADRFSEGDLRWLEVDTDFDAMREDPRFKAFVAQIRERLGLVA